MNAPHNIAQAKEAERWFHSYEMDLLIIREFIDSEPLGMSTGDAEKFGKEYERLSKTTVDLGNRFTQSIKGLEQEKKDRRVNLATLLTIAVAAPALLYNTVKARGEEFATAATVAQGMLMTFGLGYYFRDSLKKSWKAAANDLSPREIRNSASFMLYYIRENIAESDLSPRNVKNSVGMLAYYVKETTAEKLKTANNELSRRVLKIKPVRKALERKNGRGKKNDLS